VTLEAGLILQKIGEEWFMKGKWKEKEKEKWAIVVLRCVRVLCHWCFWCCKTLERVIFESVSMLWEMGDGRWEKGNLRRVD
jgi:hypothetical protein